MFTRRTRALCLLSALIATTVYAYTAESDLRDVVGADELAGCKKPCSDTALMARYECDHVAGIPPEDQTDHGCHKNRCTINNYHLFSCDPGEPASDAGKCEYHFDNLDWYRYVTVRKMPCTDLGEDTQTLPECQYAGPKNSFTTPCRSVDCWGELYLDNPEKMGRRLCGP